MNVLIILGSVVGGVFVLLFGLRIWMAIKMQKMQGKPVPDLPGRLGKAVRKGNPTIFYFYSPSCGACKAMTPVIQKMAKKGKSVFPVDISRDMDTARKFGVMATPTTILVSGGKVEQVRIGPQPEAELAHMVA